MGAKTNILVVLIGLGAMKLYSFTKNPPMVELDPNPWWGPKSAGKEDESIRPFKINVPLADIIDLKTRLSLPLRLASPLENANFTYGFNSEVLTKIVKYWETKYDWKKREQRLNSFPHFKTQIEGLDIHFVHLKPKSVDPSKHSIVPLLMIHGWPGSFVEFDEILPLLTSPREGSDVVFEVICPSIPGYGFSQSPSKQGFGTLQTAQIFKKLMSRLNFKEFYVQGGDWGSLIAANMATLYEKEVIGMHSNMPVFNTPGANIRYFLGSVLPSGFIMRKEDEPSLYPVSKVYSELLRESGYLHLQSTKPDTIGAALSNTPVGLAAYILEKFSTWTHKTNPFKPDGGLLSKDFPISLDRLLDNVSLYWFTQTITSSMRYYAESFVPQMSSKIDQISTHVPAGFSAFSQEIFAHPENLASHKYNHIVSYKKHTGGGHFAAMELPEILSADVHEFATEVQRRNLAKEKGKI